MRSPPRSISSAPKARRAAPTTPGPPAMERSSPPIRTRRCRPPGRACSSRSCGRKRRRTGTRTATIPTLVNPSSTSTPRTAASGRARSRSASSGSSISAASTISNLPSTPTRTAARLARRTASISPSCRSSSAAIPWQTRRRAAAPADAYTGATFDGYPPPTNNQLLGLDPVWTLDSSDNGDVTVVLQASICNTPGQCGSGKGRF